MAKNGVFCIAICCGKNVGQKIPSTIANVFYTETMHFAAAKVVTKKITFTTATSFCVETMHFVVANGVAKKHVQNLPTVLTQKLGFLSRQKLWQKK